MALATVLENPSGREVIELGLARGGAKKNKNERTLHVLPIAQAKVIAINEKNVHHLTISQGVRRL